MANLVCLGGGVEAVPIVQRVQELGHRVIVVDQRPDCPAACLADAFLRASCYDAGSVKALIAYEVDGVLCCAVDAPVVAAKIAAAFGLPGLSVEVAQLSQDKMAQAELLEQAYIPVPWFSGIKEYSILCYSRGFVVKPVDSRGGRGVIRLVDGVYRPWAYEQARAASPTGRVMVEQWLDGPQLSTESIVQDGQVLFTSVALRNYRRLDEFAPYVIEDGSDTPAEFYAPFNPYGDSHPQEIDRTIQAACADLGWYQHSAGTVKGDLVIHDDQFYIIELAARLSGGFFASHITPLAYGVDLVGAAIRAALGERLEKPKPALRQYVCQRFVFPEREDIGRKVEHIPLFEMRIAGFENSLYMDDPFCTWNIKIGQTIQRVTSHPARWGQVITTGRTPDEARRRAEDAVKTMKTGVRLV